MRRPTATFLRHRPCGIDRRGGLLPSAAHPPACCPAQQQQQQRQQQQQQQQQQQEACSTTWLRGGLRCVRPWGSSSIRCSTSAASPSTAAGSPPTPSQAAAAAAVPSPSAATAATATAAAATAATATAAAATAGASTYRFKSEAHRAMVVACTRLHLQDLLLQRFGGLRTAECLALRKAEGVRRLLLIWAELLVQQNPHKPQADAFFVPEQLYQHTEIQALLKKDRVARWLLRRIDPKGVGGPCDSTEDWVPPPTFPSVLQHQLPQFPYKPQEIELMRDTYGLLKWPFKPISAPAPVPAAAAGGGGGGERGEEAATRLPRVSEAEPTPVGVGAAVAAVAAAVDRGDVQRANSTVLTACGTNDIYRPDEMETGAYTLC